MLQIKNIGFLSSDGRHQIMGKIYSPHAPKAIIQISHGMKEHMGRYDDFARAMCDMGFAVCGHDHLGHGNTAIIREELGYFGPKDGYKHLFEDLHTLTVKARNIITNVPIFILGHSLGSLVARHYITRYGHEIAGCILSGTPAISKNLKGEIFSCKTMAVAKGDKHRSKLVNNLKFGPYSKSIENSQSEHDWLTRDEELCKIYGEDPFCTFDFTLSGYIDILNLMAFLSKKDTLFEVPSDLPILIMAGDSDPCGENGAAPKKLFEDMQGVNLTNVRLKLYEDARHEPLNEINKAEVYSDILTWCNEIIALGGVYTR